ncbi:MAG TPA: hypothetical protein VK772_17670 [Puia sp.]|jgi:hypothetical protein|nr:hypothetical protein [Puia sp.]
MTKSINFVKANIISTSTLVVYFLWWLEVLNFSNTQYDNHPAGAYASVFMGIITVALIITYTICFLVAAFKTGNWKKYLLFISLLFIPVAITLMRVYFKSSIS